MAGTRGIIEFAATAVEASDPVRHQNWARAIALEVARNFKIKGEQERDDLTSVAMLEVCRLRAKFDPPPLCKDLIGSFRGWVWRYVKTACQREAERLLNGGTYHERRRTPGVKLVVPEVLSTIRVRYSGPYEAGDDEGCNIQDMRDLDDRPWWERRKSA